MKTSVQISLDVTDINEAVETVRMALSAGVDWLEAGTPLIIAEGMNGVRALRREFPDVPIVADLKTMDGGWLEAQMMAQAGATHVVVMERAHEETIREMVAYSVSKGGLMTLSRNIADAHATENIRINHFNLGWVLTPNEYELKQKEGLPPNWPSTLPSAFAPSGRILAPEEITHYALAFVSEAGGPVSGSVVELEQYPIIGRNPVK